MRNTAFITGAVATGLLGFEEIGATLYLSHIISALAVGVVMSFYNRKEHITKKMYMVAESKKTGFTEAVSESVKLMAYVCGFVIFFAVVTEILRRSGIIMLVSQYFPERGVASGIIYGMLEMTNGISALSSSVIGIPTLCAVSFVLGFGGLSVILQVHGIIKKYNLSTSVFAGAKLLQGIISATVTCVILSISDFNMPVFAANADMGILNMLALSIKIFAIFGI